MMNDNMSISEMMDALRMLRNMANGMKIAHSLNSNLEEAQTWERGANAVQKALAILDESQRMVGSISFLMDAYKNS